MRCYNAGRRRRTNKQLKIELLSQWKLEAEFRNILPRKPDWSEVPLSEVRNRAAWRNRRYLVAVVQF